MISEPGPWLAHLVVVLVSAFVLGGKVRYRLLECALSLLVGLLLVFALARSGKWLEAERYWESLSLGLNPANFGPDTAGFVGLLIFSWFIPVFASFGIAYWRSLSRPSQE